MRAPGIILGLALLLWPGSRFAACAEEAAFDAFAEFEDEFADEQPVRDPLRPYNRFMFRCNDRAYFWVLRPLARCYAAIVPQDLRACAERFTDNLESPVRFVNCALQGKFRAAGREAGRFGVNSTIGILGLFDPALTHLNMPPAEEDFGQTLGRYGVGEGWPLVLPLLGQSNIRDAIGLLPDQLLKLSSYAGYVSPAARANPVEWGAGVWCADRINFVSLNIGVYESLKDDALDPYTMLRDAYTQMRRELVKK